MSHRLVAISDTHGLHRQLTIPDGDILIHAGDITGHGQVEQVADFNEWLGTLPHRHKIVIAGNHDFCFENESAETAALLTNCIYLFDEAITLDGLNFYGSPWQPWFFNWAFNLRRGPKIRAKWELIPTGTDVLITHGPPRGQGDLTSLGKQVGCADLGEVIGEKRPRLHIFGHIHEGYGVTHNEHTTFINASSCTLQYQPVQRPIVFDWP
jgi:Icc-related predicted phosphoesterase